MGNGSSRLQEPSAEVKLLWTRGSAALYKRLSLNITREICDYLKSYPALVAIQPFRVLNFSPETLQLAPLFLLTEGMIVESGASFCTIGHKEVFMCGGGERECECED